ncbi:TetR/AcrR family transcriptional regulator [Actinomadura sp. WMMA1423]|uniref:TetR/AcrR family transcriptional regulator n=1 Tax=Actinomadura sp. WMMA1423 TaxID=2591108 RepID=UPI001146AF58|nr:TetR/AcrR family transcriptional regulator [Actinomadura sp. WMMA1423]
MTTSSPPRRSAAWNRVFDTATRLFYAEGVHAVGVDRIIAEAGVAKATFYHHFPSKDDLVLAYIAEQSRRQRGLADLPESASPREAIGGVFERMCEVGADPAYRGCPFINAAAEYPDPAHPVRRAIDEFREWLRSLFRELLTAGGHPHPDRTAQSLMLLRDGLAVGFDLDDPDHVRAAVRETVTRLLGPAPTDPGETNG